MKTFVLVLVAVTLCQEALSQNIGINVNGAAPHQSALLDIDASAIIWPKRGLLIPRMSTLDRNSIPIPAFSLLIFNTEDSCYQYFNGATWSSCLAEVTEIPTVASVKTIFPQPVYPSFINTNMSINNNTSGYVGMFRIENPIVVNSINLGINTVTTAGALKIGIYSEDGQSKMLDQTTGVIATTDSYTQVLSGSLTLPTGNYYFMVVPLGSADIGARCWRAATGSLGTEYNLLGKPKPIGSIVVTAGTLPTTFDPIGDVTYLDDQHGLVIIRFDN